MSRWGCSRGALLIGLSSCATTVHAQLPGSTRELPIPGTEVALSLVLLPSGTFRMGSDLSEPGRDDDEGPRRSVRLEASWMTVHEVTHDQFAPFRFARLDGPAGPRDDTPFDADAVTRPSPPYEDPSHGMEQGNHPATGMTRLSALHYARWLSEKTGSLLRLPTEAEWEYACRAGSDQAFGFGADPSAARAHAWFEANSSGRYHPVASREPNAWGLHDMHGNVAEWVVDGYRADAYAALPEDETTVAPLLGPAGRGRGVVRGGAFDDDPARLRCAERFPEATAWKARDPQMPKSRWWNTDSPHVGFRLVSPAVDHTLEEIRAYWAELLGG